MRVAPSRNERRVDLTHREEAEPFSANPKGVTLSQKRAERFLISSFVRSAIDICLWPSRRLIVVGITLPATNAVFPVFAHNPCVIIVIIYARHQFPDHRLAIQENECRQRPNASSFGVEQEGVASGMWAYDNLIAPLRDRGISFWNHQSSVFGACAAAGLPTRPKTMPVSNAILVDIERPFALVMKAS
jgi:hypothetical protein